MIRAISYPQRRCLAEPEGCQARFNCSPASALAFYNTDSASKQEQSSIQTGAQTGGVALNNVQMTLKSSTTQPAATAYKDPSGSWQKQNSPVDVPGSGGGGVTQILSINTDTNAGAAIAALQTAIAQSANNNSQLTNSFSTLAEKTTALADKNFSANNGTTGMNTLQYIAMLGSILGGAWIAWKIIFNRKS